MKDWRIHPEQWRAQRVGNLPSRWQRRILAAWDNKAQPKSQAHTAEGDARRAANIWLRELTDDLDGAVLPLDASDAEVCARAEQLARRCMDCTQRAAGIEELHAAMVRVCQQNRVEPPPVDEDGELGPGIARMICPQWWRRALRKGHARSVEGAAIDLGLVNRAQDPYISDESLHRRLQQKARNQAALEATTARNEEGQEFTLAELAAKTTANAAIRRAELMTRIAGFERIARELEHAGMFLTITCPSRMHKWRTVKGGRVAENRRYDGTTPRQAQAYLASVWARIRASLKRQGLGLYGFRIAEPNHDGTPHWHLLVFHEAEKVEALRATIAHYALDDSPDEAGAERHRVDFKPIDWSKGSAAGYIAKYVSKNIDGYRLEKDLLGNDALETSARVEAWASTWGIRQFQQIGGPPVGVWRELRRVKELPQGAPEHLQAAHAAVNKIAKIEGRENQSVAWDRYVKAQGGVFCGRNHRIHVTKEQTEQRGRYGEKLPAQPVGVETVGKEIFYIGHLRAERVVHWFVESSRHSWQIVKTAANAGFDGLKTALRAAWTCVNNCTGEGKKYESFGHDGAAGFVQKSRDTARIRGLGISPSDGPSHGGPLRGTDDGGNRGPEHGSRGDGGRGARHENGDAGKTRLDWMHDACAMPG